MHTRFSDGAFTVDQILDMAEKNGVATMSITDHDTMGAYPYAIEEGKKRGIEVIAGTELSCELEGHDIHILGYFLDYTDPALVEALEKLRNARYYRAKAMVEKLNEQGVDLRFETVLRYADGGAIGRPHIASALVHEELVYSFKEAFDTYIGYNSPAYVEKMQLTPKECFQLIYKAGGVPILAHPGVTAVDHLIPQLIEDGLAGLEVYHAEHNGAARRRYANICRTNRLLFTGGSDFHCFTHKPHQVEVGGPDLRPSLAEGLKQHYYSFVEKNV